MSEPLIISGFGPIWTAPPTETSPTIPWQILKVVADLGDDMSIEIEFGQSPTTGDDGYLYKFWVEGSVEVTGYGRTLEEAQKVSGQVVGIWREQNKL